MPSYQFPFICTAARRSRCPETGKAVRKGDICGYYPAERLQYHCTSEHFQDIAAVLAVDAAEITPWEVASVTAEF